MKYLFDLKQKEASSIKCIEALKNKIKSKSKNIEEVCDAMKYADSSQARDQDMRVINSLDDALRKMLETLKEKEINLKEIQEEIKKGEVFFEKQPNLF